MEGVRKRLHLSPVQLGEKVGEDGEEDGRGRAFQVWEMDLGLESLDESYYQTTCRKAGLNLNPTFNSGMWASGTLNRWAQSSSSEPSGQCRVFLPG